jgi:hypothetical protein
MNDNTKYLGLTSNKISRLENGYYKGADMNKSTNIDDLKISEEDKAILYKLKSTIEKEMPNLKFEFNDNNDKEKWLKESDEYVKALMPICINIYLDRKKDSDE